MVTGVNIKILTLIVEIMRGANEASSKIANLHA